MDKEKAWQSASISTFEINKEIPFLDKELSVSNIKQSYNDKLNGGYEEGLKKAEQVLNEYKNSLDSILEALLKPLKEIDEEVIQAITQLSISISKQIIRRELKINSEQVVAIVKEAIKLLPLDKNRLIIHLNPRDMNIIRKVFNNDDIADNYTLMEDPSIEAGGCKIATEDSSIDATVESQIAQIATNILGSQRVESEPND